ncbi:hypothetical protein NFI96_010361 [Prochilodus magdalenae]|nr:hypothetical protein NFI96_010361 [Prochilodus magdalenae]
MTGMKPVGRRDVAECGFNTAGHRGHAAVRPALHALRVNVSLFQIRGWYVVWQLFLSKFKFLRELVGDTGSPQAETEPSESESERSSPPTPRHRPKTARQRVVPQSSTT